MIAVTLSAEQEGSPVVTIGRWELFELEAAVGLTLTGGSASAGCYAS